MSILVRFLSGYAATVDFKSSQDPGGPRDSGCSCRYVFSRLAFIGSLQPLIHTCQHALVLVLPGRAPLILPTNHNADIQESYTAKADTCYGFCAYLVAEIFLVEGQSPLGFGELDDSATKPQATSCQCMLWNISPHSIARLRHDCSS